tara:strand:- start:2243 stop:2416 length:174 start_codon:yes stop_codon:yes gene_type:complete
MKFVQIQSGQGSLMVYLLWGTLSFGVIGYDREEGNYILFNIILFNLIETSIELGVRK